MNPEGGRRAAADRFALAVATVFGIGYAPVASGTFGSVPGVLLAWGLALAGGPWAVVAALAVVIPLGIWASDRAAARLGATDPKPVVVDEVAGQLVTLAFLPTTWPVLAVGFFVFRALDVWKPFPADKLESLPGGSGIMADDLMAGLYGNLLLHLAAWFFPGWMGPA